MAKLEDIIFTEIDASWGHHPHEDALVVTTKIANSLIHHVLIDSVSAVNIFYRNVYQNIKLKWVDLRPMTSSLYGFTIESVISEGPIKLVITLGQAPRTTTTVIDFLVVDCSSALNRVLGRPLLRTMKAVTSIHCLIMKFSTMTGTDQVRGRQWDSRECYKKSLKLVEKRK